MAKEAAEHKQVTVLFADICGSTEIISGMDAEDASLALGAVLEVIGTAVRRFGGVVNQRLGDGVMALFGVPVATEDHAAQACFAALAIVEDVSRMGALAPPVRVGMCSGPVIIRRSGRDESDYEVAGVTVHIAARLEQRAEPGVILLPRNTLQLVTGIAQTTALGPAVLKGLTEPLDLYRLISAHDQSSWAIRSGTRPLSPFVGRADELAQMTTALREAWGHRSLAVALVGDAGIGKSRLVHEFLDAVPPGDWRLIRFETTIRSMAVPYVLLTATLRQLADCPPDATLAEVAARLPAAVAALGLDAGQELSPLLMHLGQDDAALPENGMFEAHRARLVKALATILHAYSQRHPLIFQIEDFHWLDESSVGLLDALRTELDSARLLWLVTTRPERRPSWEVGSGSMPGSSVCTIELAPLTAAQSNAMLGNLLGSGTELAPLRALVNARACGTPFFVEELIHSLREQGVLDEGALRLSDVIVPASIQGILAARIDRLSPQHRRILQIAAVIGRDVSWTLLSAIADLPASAVTEALAVLHSSRFLTVVAGSGGAVHSFSHALTYAVTYDTMLRKDRQALHERTLRALEALSPTHDESSLDELAHHAAAAKMWPQAARYALAAGERASRRSAPTEAKAYLKAAIDALDRQPATLEILSQGIDARLGLRGVYASLTDAAGMQEMLQATLAEADHLAVQAGNRLTLARVYVSRGAMLSHWGDLSGAIELSRTALAIMRAENDPPGIVGAAFALVQALWYAGDLLEAEAILAENIAHARSPEGQQRSSATFVLPAVGFYCYLARIQSELGRYAESVATIAEARTLAARIGGLFDQVLVDLNEGAALLAAGELEHAVNVLERTLDVARANALKWHVPTLACLLGTCWVEMGRNEEARELLEEASAFADQNRHVATRLRCSPPLIRALAGAPFYDGVAARTLADRTLKDATLHGFKLIVRQTYAALAEIEAKAL